MTISWSAKYWTSCSRVTPSTIRELARKRIVPLSPVTVMDRAATHAGPEPSFHRARPGTFPSAGVKQKFTVKSPAASER